MRYKMDLAPIGISTYNRINHLKKTITALQENTLAKESELYIFSDAPQKGDEEIVFKIREYIHTVDGFKKVHIIERETNGRVANNRGGFQYLLDKYGKAIFLEDDIVTAKGFLQFMNDALNFYEDDDNIISISAYTPPITLPGNFIQDIFSLQRHSSWGMGMWKKKLNLFELNLKQHGIESFLNNSHEIKQFSKNGEDMYNILLREYNGDLDALDVKLMYYAYKYKKYTIYPRKSLVQNIGHDGSGIHCGVNDKYYHEELWDKKDDFHFIKDIQPNPLIVKVNQKFRRISYKHKLINFTKKLGIYSMLKIIKDI